MTPQSRHTYACLPSLSGIRREHTWHTVPLERLCKEKFKIFDSKNIQFDMLCCEYVVHVNMKFCSSLLELALFSCLDWYQVVVEPTSLVDLQHEAALLGVVGLVGHVGDGRHVAQAAPVLVVAQNSSTTPSTEIQI